MIRAKLVILPVMLINTLVAFAVPFKLLTRLLRVFMLIDRQRNVRDILISVVSSIRRISYTIILLVFNIFFFSLLTHVLYSVRAPPTPHSPPFPTLTRPRTRAGRRGQALRWLIPPLRAAARLSGPGQAARERHAHPVQHVLAELLRLLQDAGRLHDADVHPAHHRQLPRRHDAR